MALVVVAAACSSNGGGNPDGGGGDGGPGTDGGGGATWKTMALPSAHSDDEITGIFYSSPTSGLISTVHGLSSSNGAVFATTATSVGAVAFDGSVSPSAGGELGGLDFEGLVKTSAGGLVAITDLNDLVSAPTVTGTFTNVKNGSTDLGGGQVAGAYFGASVTYFAQDLNGFFKASSPPSASAAYTDISDPGSNPTVPNPIPSNECQDEIRVADSFESGLSSVAFSADGNTIAYTTYSDADAVPEVCISKDGGQTFLPTEFAGKPQLIPGGVIFPKPSDTSTLIVYSGDLNDATANYQTWAMDTTGVAAKTASAKLHTVFALDTTHVWMGGEKGTLIAYTP